jgi:hypothetical protein
MSLEGKSADEVLSEINRFFSGGRVEEAVSLLKGLTEKEPDNLSYHDKLKNLYSEAA